MYISFAIFCFYINVRIAKSLCDFTIFGHCSRSERPPPYFRLPRTKPAWGLGGIPQDWANAPKTYFGAHLPNAFATSGSHGDSHFLLLASPTDKLSYTMTTPAESP